MLTPAYAMNENNAGTHTRTCQKCGQGFTAIKTSALTVCKSCVENAGGKHCGRCATTGQFITGTTNGIPTGPGGQCFRCQGKGYQTKKDMRRNDYYDRHRPVSL